MSRADAIQLYQNALKAGHRYYNAQMMQHKSPYPVVLDDLINDTQISGQLNVGVVEIPLSYVIGTMTAGRKTAFAGNFMPLLNADTEFAGKWISLCQAQLEEGGIRDAIKCIEFMGRFYVIEGNKRVSVLKSFGAATIMADVTRMIPVWSDTPEVKAYYAFMRFYKVTGLYQVQFSDAESYDRLYSKLKLPSDSHWSRDDVSRLASLQLHISHAVNDRLLQRLPGRNVSDIMMECLDIYSMDELLAADDARLLKMISAILQDMENQPDETPDTYISTEPGVQEKGIVRQFLSDISRPAILNIAFILSAAPEKSEWAAAHSEGMQRLTEAFENQVKTQAYIAGRDDADTVMEQAVSDGAQVIFVTAPLFMGPARRIAALHPSVKVLVCALSVPYTGIRTYYGRVYEAKFVLGAIAGALCGGEPIGCIARYPILGVPAAINAFALGASLTCPNAKVLLEWSCLPGDPYEALKKAGAKIITSQPGTVPELGDGAGLFAVRDDGLVSLAGEVWNWGRMYQKIVRSILEGGWDQDDGAPSVNYWWGMNGGVINVRLSDSLPGGTVQMANILRSGLSGSTIQPFLAPVKDQNGVLRLDGAQWLSPIEIMQMNWLCESVVGTIPGPDDVLEMSRETTRLLALPGEHK